MTLESKKSLSIFDLGLALVEQGHLTRDQLSVAEQQKLYRQKLLPHILLDLGFIDPLTLLKVQSELTGIEWVDLNHRLLDRSLIEVLPQLSAEHLQAIVLGRTGDQYHVAMADPLNLLALDQLKSILKGSVKPYFAAPSAIMAAIEGYYPVDSSHTHSHQVQVVELLDDIILQAVRRHASDIHLQPHNEVVEILFRLDGLLSKYRTLHKDGWQSMTVRLKVLAGLDIAESRKPQSGRFTLTIGGREVDFRLSSHPTIHGENMVLRVLDKAKTLFSLETLGFSEWHLATLRKLIRRPQGIVLVSGPTGSGKTTTLYSLLSLMDAQKLNIMTLEDPVEYYLPGIRQSEIRKADIMDFPEGIRSLLRQDPDVIFIAEIRDEKTAQMALRAAMTGHLVLSTVHTNTAATVPARLLDLGLSPSLLAGHIVGIVAQRLVRKICSVCKGSHCQHCFQTGYKGRLAVAEIVEVTTELDLLLAEGASTPRLQHFLNQNKIPSMKEDALRKVEHGLTTPDEVKRVLGESD